MTAVKPFKAIRYNPENIKDLSRVVAPPYDIIPKEMQNSLYRTHPFNIVRLILGRVKSGDDAGDNRYTRAKKRFEEWLDRRIMVRDEFDAIYVYSQSYKKGKKIVDMAGFIALMGLDIGKETSVLPHENTLAAPKQDRLNLIREVGANLSPIFVLYDDAGHAIRNILEKVYRDNSKKLADVKFDNVRHRIWRLDDRRDIDKIEALMAGKRNIFIADGHHRYETARNYSMELRRRRGVPDDLKRSSGYMMAYFVESDEKMLTILPAHRLIKDTGALKKEDILSKLGEFFNIQKVAGAGMLASQMARNARMHIFGMYLGKKRFYVLRLKDFRRPDRVITGKSRQWKSLDVSILHLFILQHVLGIRDEDDNIEFVKSPFDTARLVDKGKYKIAFFLNPTKVSQVKHIARLGEKMPRKATYFYPKPLSGLVINKFGD